MKNFTLPKALCTCWFSVVLFVCVPRMETLAQQGNGKYTSHYPNGHLKESGLYKDGAKHKTWYYYSEGGLMERKEKWKFGVMVWQIYYSPKGKVIKTVDKNGNEKVPAPCNCQ